MAKLLMLLIIGLPLLGVGFLSMAAVLAWGLAGALTVLGLAAIAAFLFLLNVAMRGREGREGRGTARKESKND